MPHTDLGSADLRSDQVPGLFARTNQEPGLTPTGLGLTPTGLV